jgi:hypothetical protein
MTTKRLPRPRDPIQLGKLIDALEALVPWRRMLPREGRSLEAGS